MLTRTWYASPSYSPGSIGNTPRLLVCHTTEGAQTNDSIKNYLTGHNGVSYHASVDNYMANVAYEYVYETDGAWAQCNFNHDAICCVYCTPGGASANWSADYWWNSQHLMMDNMAKWLAEEASQHDIPLVALTDSQAQGGSKGVCEHLNLGSTGCGHSDCGRMPMDKLLNLAKQYQGGGTPQPPKPKKEAQVSSMLLVDFQGFDRVNLPIEANAKSLRITSAQTGRCTLRYMGSGVSREFEFTDDASRYDFSVPEGQTGLVQVVNNSLTGPLYAAWIFPVV